MGWLGKIIGPRAIGQDAVKAALADIAAHHELDGDDERVTGNVVGYDVDIERERVAAGGVQAERLVLRVRLPKKLDVGLRVTMAAEADPRRPFKTGDAPFDASFVCLADEPPRGLGMVTPAVRALMMEGPETDIGDGGVTIAVAAADAGRLGDALGYGLDLAKALDEARKSVPAAAALRDAERAWHALQGDLPLAIEATPLSAELKVGRVLGEARAVRDGFGQHHFELRATFARPLYVGMRIRPFSGSQDQPREAVALGDPEFDRLFDVVASGTPVHPLFDGEVRGRMLALRREGLQIRGDDRAVTAWLGYRKDSLDSAVWLLRPLGELADAIEARVEASAAVRSV